MQDKPFVLSAIKTAYKDVQIMQQTQKQQEFLGKIVQVRVLPPPHTKPARLFLSVLLVHMHR